MKKNKTAELAKMIKEQDAASEPEEDIKNQFEESTESVAVTRLQLCLLIFLLLFPFLGFIDYYSRGFSNPRLSISLRFLMELILMVFSGLTYIPQFKRNVYVFTFLLTVLIGIHNLLILLFEGQAAMDHYIIFALIFSLLGVVMPWGGRAMAGICIPVYLFYPLGIVMGRIPMTGNFFIKSNLYLILFMTIVVIGASINEHFRFQEFSLKKRMEGVNRVLEDYQTRLKRSYSRMENLAIIDPLTGVYNRMYLTQWLTAEVHKGKTPFEVFSILMYDVDQFKEVNDLAGHQMGDRTLQRLTEIVQENLEGPAPMFRYGGDEFCVILPGQGLRQAVATAEKIRKNVASHPDLLVKFSPTSSLQVTISIGIITDFVTGAIDPDYLIRWVDAALLESKRQGRNCIHVFDQEERKIRNATRWLESA